MANPATLQPRPFTSENQPANRGRKKGSRNRATVYREILETKIKVKMPDGAQKQVTLYEAAALGITKAAMKGSHGAWNSIQDDLHGKIPQANVNIDLNDEMRQLAEQLGLAPVSADEFENRLQSGEPIAALALEGEVMDVEPVETE